MLLCFVVIAKTLEERLKNLSGKRYNCLTKTISSVVYDGKNIISNFISNPFKLIFLITITFYLQVHKIMVPPTMWEGLTFT